MVARMLNSRFEPQYVRLLVLAYGLNHAYRVLSIDEIAVGLPPVGRKELKEALERLALEGLVTRFSGRFCFNKAIPGELRQEVEHLITSSGTIRQRTTVSRIG